MVGSFPLHPHIVLCSNLLTLYSAQIPECRRTSQTFPPVTLGLCLSSLTSPPMTCSFQLNVLISVSLLTSSHKSQALCQVLGEAKKMVAHSVKCLPHKWEDLNSHPPYLQKRVGTLMHCCHPHSEEQWRQEDPQDLLTGPYRQSNEGRQKKTPNINLWPPYAQVHLCIHTHPHTYTCNIHTSVHHIHIHKRMNNLPNNSQP